jgi:excisionase family DNA binding protein
MKLWLNVADAAEHAGVCRDTIYTAVERGELRHVRIGGRRSIRIKTEWVDGWLERAVRPPSLGSSSEPYGTSGG